MVSWHLVGIRGATGLFLEGGRRYFCYLKDEIVHGLSPSVNCVAPVVRGMSLVKVRNSGGRPTPSQVASLIGLVMGCQLNLTLFFFCSKTVH